MKRIIMLLVAMACSSPAKPVQAQPSKPPPAQPSKGVPKASGALKAYYCNDAESKKAMCAMKSLDITKGKDTKFSLAGGKGSAITDGQSYVSFDMMTREIDK